MRKECIIWLHISFGNDIELSAAEASANHLMKDIPIHNVIPPQYKAVLFTVPPMLSGAPFPCELGKKFQVVLLKPRVGGILQRREKFFLFLYCMLGPSDQK